MANSSTARAGPARLLSDAGPTEGNPAAGDGQIHEAVIVLRPVRDHGLSDQRRYLGIYLAVGPAVIVADETARAEPTDEFHQSLSPAASTCISQVIAAAGPKIVKISSDFLEFVRRNGTSGELMIYASELMGRWNEIQGVDKQQPKTITDVLSPREITIVELIGRGRSNKEMARHLGIAPETVKTHIKNIFLKLGVERRAHAIARARILGLIEPGRPLLVG